MTKIGAEVDSKSILCLQELSRPWSGPLQTYLSGVDYELITGLYGRPFNGYMGVALAFPKSEYTLEEVWNENLADTVKWPRDPKEQEVREWRESRGRVEGEEGVMRGAK